MLFRSTYPRARITAVSNSHGQRKHIEGEARARGLTNLTVVTQDMNRFDTDQRFDRIVSVGNAAGTGARIALLDRKAPRADGKSYATQLTYVADRPGHDRRYAINCTKLQRELGWAPQESFATGIEKTVDWYLKNRAWAAEITSKRYARERLGTG